MKEMCYRSKIGNNNCCQGRRIYQSPEGVRIKIGEDPGWIKAADRMNGVGLNQLKYSLRSFSSCLLKWKVKAREKQISFVACFQMEGVRAMGE